VIDLLVWALMTIDTSGGTAVGGNANTRDFTGRDAADHRNYIDIDFSDRNNQRSNQSLEDRVLDLERLVYGEPRWQEPGMIKREQRQLYISHLNLALNVAGFIVLLGILMYTWS
jgi:hypothetical protein